jgi:hypothetical protein
MNNILQDILKLDKQEVTKFLNSLSFSQMHFLNESINLMHFDNVTNLYEEMSDWSSTTKTTGTKPTQPTQAKNASTKPPTQFSNSQSNIKNDELDDILQNIQNSSNVEYKNNQLHVKDPSGKEKIYSKDQVDQISSDPEKVKEIEKKKPGVFSKMASNAIDNFNPIGSFIKGYNSAKLESIDSELNEELETLKRLAGVNGKNENCAGTKAETPSIIGNTSDSHKPTSKLRHELRKKLVAKERMKDNKFKKPT